jgi:hypothetical protein
MKTEINGVIVAGKVYEEVRVIYPFSCIECAFASKIGCALALSCPEDAIYRYSPELTEKLNKK